MPQVTQYRVLFYGSPDGFANRRAEIYVYEGANLLGYVRFYNPGVAIPNDSLLGNALIMNLPSSMLPNVLDVLRNEKPVFYGRAFGIAVLSTRDEPVGEAE